MKSLRSLEVLWAALSSTQRRQFVLLQIASVAMALSTLLGLAAIMIFFAVLADPRAVESHALLRWIVPVNATRPALLATLAAGIIALFVANAAINVLGARAIGRFAYSIGDRIRELLFADYLRRDYLFHLRAGAARLTDDVLHQPDRITVAVLHGQLFITNSVLTLLTVVSIAVVNPAVAMIGAAALAGAYLLFYRVVRRRLARNGRVLSQVGAERVAVVEQAFLGIKHLLMARAQASFSRRFGAVTRTMSEMAAETTFLGQFPKYVLECAAGTILIASALWASGTSSTIWLAQLSFIGFAGFRLLPAVQQMYGAFALVRANLPAIDHLAAELSASARTGADESILESNSSIELSGVSFRYDPDKPRVLDAVSLRIPIGAAIGIIGASGSGKTTLADIITGLLKPDEGRIDIGGVALDSDELRASWRASIGYVPQDVMILDASVRENVAFGLAPERIDDARVRDVLRLAGAEEFVATLPGGITAKLAAIGGGLSGGQRQRIGIARALYRDPGLLVLDEATNSLDVETERAILDCLVRQRGARTLIVVAHGSEAIGACDLVYEVRAGALIERGAVGGKGRTPHRFVGRGG